jgi:hypothetical protein
MSTAEGLKVVDLSSKRTLVRPATKCMLPAEVSVFNTLLSLASQQCCITIAQQVFDLFGPSALRRANPDNGRYTASLL